MVDAKNVTPLQHNMGDTLMPDAAYRLGFRATCCAALCKAQRKVFTES
jgi:hypothetical protein